MHANIYLFLTAAAHVHFLPVACIYWQTAFRLGMRMQEILHRTHGGLAMGAWEKIRDVEKEKKL